MLKYEIYTEYQADPVYAGITYCTASDIDEWDRFRLKDGWYFTQLEPGTLEQYSELTGPFHSTYSALNEMLEHFEAKSAKGI